MLVGASNKDEALVGAFSGYWETSRRFVYSSAVVGYLSVADTARGLGRDVHVGELGLAVVILELLALVVVLPLHVPLEPVQLLGALLHAPLVHLPPALHLLTLLVVKRLLHELLPQLQQM